MAEQIIRAIRFKSQKDSESNPAEMHVIIFTQREQKIRALKSMMTFWVIAALCIFIPIAHFILVPGFLIGGIVAASRRWKTKEEELEATGSCPACHNGICIKLDKSIGLPQWKNCPECADSLELQAASENREA